MNSNILMLADCSMCVRTTGHHSKYHITRSIKLSFFHILLFQGVEKLISEISDIVWPPANWISRKNIDTYVLLLEDCPEMTLYPGQASFVLVVPW